MRIDVFVLFYVKPRCVKQFSDCKMFGLVNLWRRLPVIATYVAGQSRILQRYRTVLCRDLYVGNQTFRLQTCQHWWIVKRVVSYRSLSMPLSLPLPLFPSHSSLSTYPFSYQPFPFTLSFLLPWGFRGALRQNIVSSFTSSFSDEDHL